MSSKAVIQVILESFDIIKVIVDVSGNVIMILETFGNLKLIQKVADNIESSLEDLEKKTFFEKLKMHTFSDAYKYL